MLLESYSLEIFNSACNPSAVRVHCYAHLDQDVSEALPYLNAVLGGFEYIENPPSVTFKAHGKLIAVHGKKIAINALKDENEAKKMVEWLKTEINEAWDRKESIIPSTKSAPRPQIIEILRLLPKTNCRECGEPTCMVFAMKVAEGVKEGRDCPAIDPASENSLDTYLSGFNLDY